MKMYFKTNHTLIMEMMLYHENIGKVLVHGTSCLFSDQSSYVYIVLQSVEHGKRAVFCLCFFFFFLVSFID